MISLPSVFVKHPSVDGLLYICNNGPLLASHPTSTAWIVARLCYVAFILCLDVYGWCWKEAFLVSSPIFLNTLISNG
jgi:hypothetical protein